MYKKTGIATAALAMALLGHGSVRAAEADAAGATSQADSTDIVVTARKRDENLQKVPISVTVFSGATLEKNGVQSFNDLSLSNPNVKIEAVQGNAVIASSVAIRGNVQSASTLQVDPSVGTYVDGYLIAHTIGSASLTVDVASVQTLKGPQGTLFGRNTTGGALLITTVDPELGAFSGYVQGDIATIDTQRLGGAINIPIGEMVALRLVYQNNHQGNYETLTNGLELGHRNDETLRAKVLIEPADGTKFVFTAEKMRQYGSATVNVISQPNNPLYDDVPYLTPTNPLADPRADGERSRVTAQRYSGTFSQDVGDGVIKLIASHRYYDVSTAESLPPAYGYTRQDKPGNKDNSVELQYNTTLLDDRLDLTSGLYYFDERVHEVQNTFRYTGIQVAHRDLVATSKSKSAYAQATVHITDRLNFTGGIRYTNDKKTGRLLNGTDPVTATYAQDVLQKNSRVNYLASIDFSPAEGLMIYANTATGYRAGGAGVDRNPLDPTRQLIFLPESVKNYEAGFKGQFFDNMLRVNAAAFLQKYSKYQYTALEIFDGASTRITRNVDAEIKGFEGETTLSLPGRFRLSGSVGYVNARVDDAASQSDKQNLPLVPRWTWSVNASKGFDVGGGKLDLVANYSWRDHYSSTLETITTARNEERETTIRPLGLLNLSATYATGPWTLSIYGNNVLDRKYYTFITQSFPVINFGALGLPRMIGARAKYAF